MLEILVTGADGQLGRSLRRLGAAGANRYTFTDVAELDITDADAVRRQFGEHRYDVVINCAAYTNVERAEAEEEAADRLNRLAVRHLAQAAAAAGATLIHISTDYVFDGHASTPYTEEAAPGPLNAYGRTKLAGEEEIAASGCRALIFRTAWLYSEFGGNFLKTMLRLTAEKEHINVVADQIGTPTYAGDLALALFSIVEGATTPAARASTTSPTRGPARGTTSLSRSPAPRVTTRAASNPAARPTTPRGRSARPTRCSTRARCAARSASRFPTGGSRCSTA